MTHLRAILLISLSVAGLAAFYFVSEAKILYESTASFMMTRPQLERANGASEESKNRWVWVRDGLELKNELLSEAVLQRALRKAEESVGESYSSDDPVAISTLRQQIKLHYSGGDDNLYTVKVRHEDPDFCVAVAKSILEQVPDLTLGKRQRALEAAIASLEANRKKNPVVSETKIEKTETEQPNPDAAGTDLNIEVVAEPALNRDTQPVAQEDLEQQAKEAEIIATLKSDVVFASAEKNSRIVIIEQPYTAVKVWPRKTFIYVAFGCFGLLIACAIGLIVKRRTFFSQLGVLLPQ